MSKHHLYHSFEANFVISIYVTFLLLPVFIFFHKWQAESVEFMNENENVENESFLKEFISILFLISKVFSIKSGRSHQ